MSSASALLQAIGTHLLDFGRIVTDRKMLDTNLFSLVENLYNEMPIEQVRDGLVDLLELPPDRLPTMIEQIVTQIAPAGVKQHAVGAFLEQVPGSLKKMLPDGVPVRAIVEQVVLSEEPEKLAQYLPPRVPRFRENEAPPSIGGWVLLKMLGQGGFGEVWLARHPTFQSTRAAIKFCIGDQNQVRLLRHEAKVNDRVMSEQLHPGVVKLLDANLEVDPPWLRYELINGGDLAKLVREWSPLPFAERVEKVNRVMLELVEIVAYFHSLTPAVVHRDLKPSNILVERLKGGEWKLRVADFGISNVTAKAVADREKRQTSVSMRGMGTLLYASMEQRLGGDPFPQDDVHALGVIWYQLVHGNVRAMIDRNGKSWQPPMRQQGLTEEYVDLIDACVDYEPDKRPRDAGVLLDRLRQIMTPSRPKFEDIQVLAERKRAEKEREDRIEVERQQSDLVSSERRREGETRLRTYLADAIDRGQGKLSPADNAEAKRIAREFGIVSADAVTLFRELHSTWELDPYPRGLPKDLPPEAREHMRHLYRKALDGEPEAQFGLGWAYAIGQYVNQDNDLAAVWFRRAAVQEHAPAQFTLGVMCREGIGTNKSRKEAAEWFEKFESQVDAHIYFELGKLYSSGTGVWKRESDAVECFREAADRGLPTAMYHLGLMLETGRGVVRDEVEAFDYYRLAAKRGYPLAIVKLKERGLM